MSWFQNPKAFTVPFLKRLYGLLLKLSPNGNGYLDKEEIIHLSSSLFDELHSQFEHLLMGTRSYLPHVVVSDENGCVTSDDSFSPEGFMLLLRCCMVILQFLEFDLTLVLDRCQVLVALLGKLCPPNSPLRLPDRSECWVAAGSSEAGALGDVFSDILEVFIDEFLVHHALRKHFTMTDSVYATYGKMFVSNCSHGDVHAVMELVCSHFLLSVYDELTFDRFIHRLSWFDEGDKEVPVLGLNSALTLLGYPVIHSAPHLLQAHLIVLASKCIGINMLTNCKRLDIVAMNLYILAFKISFKLYSGVLPILDIGEKSESCFIANGLSFSSCIRSMTFDNLSHQIDRFISFCHLHSHGLQSLTEEEILDSSIAYIKGNQNFIDESFRDQACSIINYIVRSTLPRESGSLHEDGENIQQEIYCVAALLKLMSSSLLQTVWCLKQNGYQNGMKTSKQYPICKEYDFISGIISCFENYGGNQHTQKIISDVLKTPSGRHNKETKLMFSHFAGMLSYSFRRRIEFLWKGCIFMMISLVNLIIFEEGNLDAFQPLLYNLKEASVSHRSGPKAMKELVHKRSSLRIASNLKKVRDQLEYQQHEDFRLGIGNLETGTPYKDNTCNGESYIQCLPNHTELDDLIDFIECTPGKDYSNWIKSRQKFRRWKYRKVASLKHKLKRKKKELLFSSCSRLFS